MHRKKINWRTEIGNYCISLLYFLQTLFPLNVFQWGKWAFTQWFWAIKVFITIFAFPKNTVLRSCRTADECIAWDCFKWCSFTVTPKLKDHFNCSVRLHNLPATVKIRVKNFKRKLNVQSDYSVLFLHAKHMPCLTIFEILTLSFFYFPLILKIHQHRRLTRAQSHHGSEEEKKKRKILARKVISL